MGRCSWLTVLRDSSGSCEHVGLEELLFSLVPSLLFVISAFLQFFILLRKETITGSKQLLLAKQIAAVVVSGLALASLVTRRQNYNQDILKNTTASSVDFVASLTVCVLSFLHHARSRRPSCLLQTYLLVSLCARAHALGKSWCCLGNGGTGASFALSLCQAAAYATLLVLESTQKDMLLPEDETGRHSPEDVNGLFSKRFFAWLLPLFRKGYTTLLTSQDLFQLDRRLHAERFYPTFEAAWRQREVDGKRAPLIRSLFWGLTLDFLTPVGANILYLSTTFAQPFLIRALLGYVEAASSQTLLQGIRLVILAALEYIGLAVFGSWYWQAVARFNTKLRACLITIIHAKALRCREAQDSSPLTLMNVDVERALNGTKALHEFWAGVISVALALYLVWTELGASAVALLVILVLAAAVSYVVGKHIRPKQAKWLESTQKRVKFFSTVPGSIKSIKISGMTEAVYRICTGLREEEVEAQRSIRKPMVVTLWLALSILQLSSLLTYLAYGVSITVDGKTLSTTVLFTSLALLKLFTQPLLDCIQYVPLMLQTVAALQRIEAFLKADEAAAFSTSLGSEVSNKNTPSLLQRGDGGGLQLVQVEYRYNLDPPVLSGLTTSIQRNSLTLILGGVSSGKSTLLRLIVGDLKPTAGSLRVSYQRIAYCGQSAWLYPGTLKDNIIGEEPFDQGWFCRVTWACCLDEDFKTLPAGVNYMIQDGGTCLSGGQKNRMSLARALYSRFELLVLDDVLVGLDNTVLSNIARRVFGPSGILREFSMTAVVATCQHTLVPFADKILVLASGRLVYEGAPGLTFLQHICAPPREMTRIDLLSEDVTDAASPTSTPSVPLQSENLACTERLPEVSSDTEVAAKLASWLVYKEYLSSFGTTGLVVYFIPLVLWIALATLQSLWLKWWAEEDSLREATRELTKYASIFAAISCASLVSLALWLSYTFWHLFPKASLELHARQLAAVMRTSFRDFIKKNAGDLTNRFSQDIALIDTQLSAAFINTSYALLTAITGLALIIVAAPYISGALPILIAVFWTIQRVYLRTSKQLRTMDLDAKAPLCSHFMVTASGSLTIHLFGWSGKYKEQNREFLHKSQIPYYLLHTMQNWLYLVLDLVVAALVALLAGMTVWLGKKRQVDPGYLGLALTSVMDLGQLFRILVVSWTQFETSLGAIARARQLIDDMPPEQEQGSPDRSKGVPKGGLVSFQEVGASYSNKAGPVLRRCSISIPKGMKLAICGRSGSGKSSFLAALLGLMNPITGTISINGVSVASMNLEALRRKNVVALPQDPWFPPGCTTKDCFAFGFPHSDGDRDAKVSDRLILSCLEKVGLRAKFEAMLRGGDTVGSIRLNAKQTLTSGEMQLFAVAVALSRSGKIVLMDESTSHLDADAETRVHKLIAEEYADCTVISVAHNLQSIMHFDEVAVMENGVFVEQGVPRDLAKQAGSRFKALLEANATARE